jgi:hypothetical protein
MRLCFITIAFSFAFEYPIRKGLELNGTLQLLVYADYVNLVAEHVSIRKKNIQALLDASNEFVLERTPRKPSICPCSATRLQDKIIINGAPLKVRQT